MSKLLNPKINPDFASYQHGGALEAMKFKCQLDGIMKVSGRFKEREIIPAVQNLREIKPCR